MTLSADETLVLIPAEEAVPQPLFNSVEDYADFREEFVTEVAPKQDEWREARRKSEEEARKRLLGSWQSADFADFLRTDQEQFLAQWELYADFI